jgi:DNA polymerase III epsilon subunit-like protein
MRTIIFDTETTGLPKVYYKSALDAAGNWPDLVSICWLVYEGREQVKKECHIIRPDGWVVPEEAARIHGITHERAMAEGRPLGEVMEAFRADVSGARVVAHNLVFDRNVVFQACRWRLGWSPLTFWPHVGGAGEFCSMVAAKDELRLPFKNGGRGWKNPSLAELYQAQFGEAFDGAHTADGDAEALARIVWARWPGRITSGA